MSNETHLLIVDDDERIRVLLQKFLMRHGYLVTSARDAQHARRILQGLAFDLIVMDVMMPGEDGISLCRSLRADLTTPILLLTAKAETDNRIEGLEAGADDFLAKPFEPKELLLRIGAILRRVPQTPASANVPQVLHMGRARYDVEPGELWYGDELVHLTTTETQLIKIFAAQPNIPITRGELIEKLGRDRGQAQERAVDVQITRLRRKIEDNPRQPTYLQTVRGEGYMLTLD